MDVLQSNGVIHLVDAVLLPSSSDGELIEAAPGHSGSPGSSSGEEV
jgi:hypothetical protein